ncbi:MAG: hypothetical protein IPP87_16490 [Ideonella sp.]|nr:hypothetical protein [Ideonella sp.]
MLQHRAQARAGLGGAVLEGHVRGQFDAHGAVGLRYTRTGVPWNSAVNQRCSPASGPGRI